jgi:ATP/maltotriose-dependent transcriptional regulator MalT/DNA-binding SARP family transcriptional activator
MLFRPVLAKIQLPPRPQKLLSRPRLLDFLSEYADVKLMAISATAGYGKTSLLVDHAHTAEMPVCWYALDRFDRDPGTFFAHLLASIRLQFPDFGQQSERTLASFQNPARDWLVLAATLVNELYETIPEYFTIVLDDYHHIENVIPINEFLAYLLQYSDEHCHLIVASRRLPRLPNQALLFGRGQMEGLDTIGLRFTAQEIQALAKQNYNLDLPSGKATELAKHFEGWITGILLTAHPGWTKLLGDAAQLRTGEHVYDYLAEQVFADQPPDVQDFLLESAILNRMSAETLDALRETDDSAVMLAQASNRNLFLVSLDDENRWFRYHQLFRDFLHSQLRREARGRFEALHRRAAELFEAQREWPEAFDHYTQAGDSGQMMRLFEAVAEALFSTGRWDTLQHWIEALPADAADTNPLVIHYQGLMLMERGDPASALPYAERAWQGFEARQDAAGSGQALLLRATALRMLGRYTEALEAGQRVLRSAAQLDGKKLLAGAQRAVGMSYYYMGQVDQAVRQLEEALELYQAIGRPFNIAQLHHELGIACRATGQWRRAVAHYRQANHLWEQLRNPGFWAITLNSVGLVHYLRGEFAEAYRVLTQALDKAQTAGYRRMQAAVLASLGDLYRDAGQYQAARETFHRSAELADEVGEGFISVYARQGLGETCRLLDDYKAALAWLSEALEGAKAHDSTYEIGLCELARGVLWIALDNQARAWISLGQAEEFFEQSGHLHELARTHFYLANLALRQGRRRDVARHLDIVTDLARQLGYDNFLVVEGRQAKHLLEYAVSLNGDGGWWTDILARATQPPVPLTAEPKKAAPVRRSLRIHALGQDRVQYGSEETKTGRPKVREFFFYLLAHRPQGVRKERIMAEFWPEATPSRAALSFKSAIYRLRRLYTEVRQEAGRYALDLPEGSWYDVEAFEALLDEAQVAETGQDRINAYRQALALYGGDYLLAFGSPWCTLERERLRERYRQGLHALADLYLSRGEYAESRELYRQALAVDEFDEAACRGLMHSFAGAGQRPQALTLYHQFASHLYREMAITPLPETEALYQELLRQDEGG